MDTKDYNSHMNNLRHLGVDFDQITQLTIEIPRIVYALELLHSRETLKFHPEILPSIFCMAVSNMGY